MGTEAFDGRESGEGGVTVEPAQALWLLSNFCAAHQKSFDAAAIARECLPPLRIDDLCRVGEQLGLAISQRSLAANAIDWSSVALPAAVQVRQSVGAEWLLILQLDSDGAVVGQATEQKTQQMSFAQLATCMTGVVLQCAVAPSAAADADSVAEAAPKFGFRWFIPELLKHKNIWREVLVASLALQVLALAFPLFTQAIIDKVVVHRTQSTLIALGVGMAIFTLFSAALSWIRQYLILHTGNKVDASLGSHVFDHLFKLPPLYFQHRPTGVIAARLQGIETIREFVSSAAVTLILDIPFLLIFVAIMFWYSVPLTWLVLFVLSLIVGASALVAPLFQHRLNEQFLRGAANQAFVTEYIAGLETVKSLQLEPQLGRRYRDQLAQYLTASFRTRQLGNTYGTIANALEQSMGLLVLGIGAYIVMSDAAFTVGMLIAFQMFSSRISQPMLRLVGLWQQFQQARISVARLGDVMNAPVEPYSLSRARAQSGRGAIQIDGLAFRYGDNLPYLFEGFGFSASPGELIVIMGPSGVGKSTLAKLLQGFYQPSRGSIRVDGIDIRHLSANELRGNFGVVPQETTLFTGTILENLRLANPFASFEQVVAACKMAEIHAVIEALPNGYETQIGERGAGLSGGQRQRIAIARALLKGPKVLVFDESTSSVDGPTAEQLGRTITALKGRATILFIAHMLPKTLQADRIVRIGERLSVVPSAAPELAQGESR